MTELEQQYANLNNNPDSSSNKFSEKHLVLFKLGGEEFGVDINEVREIIKFENVTRIPNTASYILGAINLRGAIITVIDLAMKLGIAPKSPDKNTRIIVMEIGSNTVGMVVDSATEVLRLKGDQVQPTPTIIGSKFQSNVNANFIDGIGTLKDRMIILLDLKRIVDMKDVEQAQHQK